MKKKKRVELKHSKNNTIKEYVSAVLEAGSLRSGCSLVRLLVGALFWVAN